MLLQTPNNPGFWLLKKYLIWSYQAVPTTVSQTRNKANGQSALLPNPRSLELHLCTDPGTRTIIAPSRSMHWRQSLEPRHLAMGLLVSYLMLQAAPPMWGSQRTGVHSMEDRVRKC